jgi:glycosidase
MVDYEVDDYADSALPAAMGEFDEIAKRAWYFHRFYDFQPDLNTSNPHVQAEILKIMGFWIQLGVSGFRMDAVPFIIATKGAKVRKPVEQYDMLRSFRAGIRRLMHYIRPHVAPNQDQAGQQICGNYNDQCCHVTLRRSHGALVAISY